MPFLYPNQNQQEENKKQKPLIIFGTASFGTGTSQAKFSSPDLANPVLDLLRARGVTHIDTARAYPVGSPGTSEALLGSLKVAEWATVSTKVTSWAPGSHTEEKIRGSVRESLEALGVGDVKREGEEREDGTTAAVTEGVDVEGEAKETAAITLEEVVNQLPLQNGSEQQDEEEEEEEEAVADARERQQESQDAKKPHPQIDIMYLHSPDRTTPFPITCAAINSHHRAGHFRRFGLSNYRADEVEQIVAICEQNNYVKPTVYQGRYNAIIRGGEEELFPVLRKHGIGFYAYSPTAAGLFSGLVGEGSVNVEGSRWDSNVRFILSLFPCHVSFSTSPTVPFSLAFFFFRRWCAGLTPA